VELSAGPTKTVVNQYLRKVLGAEGDRLAGEIQVRSEQRWGTFKIEITKVSITDSTGVEQSIFQTGDQVVIEMEYFAHEQVESPIFGLAVHRQDGIHVTGPNTDLAELSIPIVYGMGKVIYQIPHLPLLDGLYKISVAVVDNKDTEMFDYHDGLYSLRVANLDFGSKEKYGMLSFNGEWNHEN
jgi:lipopolysaccharide transport system ATP-binding protein